VGADHLAYGAAAHEADGAAAVPPEQEGSVQQVVPAFRRAGAIASPAARRAWLTPEAVLALQRTAGNRVVSGLLARAPGPASAPPKSPDAAGPPMPQLSRDQRLKLERIRDRLEKAHLSLEGDVFPDAAALAAFLKERESKLDGAIFRVSEMANRAIDARGLRLEHTSGGDKEADIGGQTATDAKMRIEDAPALPKRTKLPVERAVAPGEQWGKEKGGRWDGNPRVGEARWFPDDPVMNAITKGEGVLYRNGEPDLAPYSSGRALIKMSGDQVADFYLADRSLAQQRNWRTPDGKLDDERARRYREALALTWHHVSDGETMLLVSQHLHKPQLPHTGGASAARRGEGVGADLSAATGRDPVPTLATQVGSALEAKRAALYHGRLTPVLREIAALEGKDELTETDRKRLAALETQSAELEAAVAAFDDDIAALHAEGTKPWVVEDIVERRTRRKTGTTVTEGFQIDEKLAAVSHENKRKFVDVKGEERKSRTTTTAHKLDLAEGSYEYSHTAERTQSAPGTSTAQTRETRVKVGLGGVSGTTGKTVRVGSEERSRSTTAGFERGDKSVGFAISETNKRGQVDAEGKMVKGTESSKKSSAGVILDREEVGGKAATTRDFKQIHAKGVQTGVTTSADGRLTLGVKRVADSDPPLYDLVLTIKLSASVGGAGGVERGASAGVDVRASGSGVVQFRHRLSDIEADQYLADLGVAAGGEAKGTNPELAIVATAGRSGGAASEGLVPDLMAAYGSAEGAR
jgi:HNH/ENDO VII superfamily nuclease